MINYFEKYKKTEISTSYAQRPVDKFSYFWYPENTRLSKLDFKEVSMSRFKDEIEALNNIETLQQKKDKIKDSVVSPHLRWDSRMELYEQVQQINLRIAQIHAQQKH